MFFLIILIKKNILLNNINNKAFINVINEILKKKNFFKVSTKYYNFFNFSFYKIKNFIPKFYSKNIKLNLISNISNYKTIFANSYYNNISQLKLKNFKLKNHKTRDLQKIKNLPYIQSLFNFYELIEENRKKLQSIKLKKSKKIKLKLKKTTNKIKNKLKLKKLKIRKQKLKLKKQKIKLRRQQIKIMQLNIYVYMFKFIKKLPINLHHQIFNEFFKKKFDFLNKTFLNFFKFFYICKINRKFIFYRKFSYLLPKKIKLTSKNYFYYCLNTFYTTQKYFYFFLLNYTYYKKSKKYLNNKLKYNNRKSKFNKKHKKINNKYTLQTYIKIGRAHV